MRRDLQVVFQDPMASLDPRLPICDILAEPMRGARRSGRRAPTNACASCSSWSGSSREHANRYPQEFSGGQRQRIGIARALALEPEAARARRAGLGARRLHPGRRHQPARASCKAELGLSYLFVAHDLSVVRHIADRVAVMYLGRIVEIGDADDVFDRPSHPYTQALLSAMPMPDPVAERQRTRILVRGDLPSPANPPSGCRFRTRCPLYAELPAEQQRRCAEDDPRLERHIDADTESACHWARERQVVPD